MKIPFRDHHLLKLLGDYENKRLPLDLVVHDYFKANKALGSKDRAEIANTVFGMIRWKGLLDFLIEKPLSWKKRLSLYREIDFDNYRDDETIPPNIRVSFPKPLFDRLVDNYGLEKALHLCQVSNTQAPMTIRVNALKTTREEMQNNWDVIPCESAPCGLMFKNRCNLFQLPEFKDGLFEVQDEGSQLLAEMMEVSPADHVLDYCAGSGGKTLAFAPKMQNTGQIFLHDIRPYILQEAKKRLKRAGIQNAQITLPKDPKLKKLKKKMNWVLVDAPCTGTGTLRRNPDMKWKYTDDMLLRLVGEQRQIFEQALSYLHPDGKIVYATCSLFKEENQDQVEHFCETYKLKVVGEVFQSFPTINGMDGFFGAVMRRI